jgi:hypothetical protein
MYKGYEPWDLEKVLKRELSHNWKRKSRMKKNRLLCGARCRDGHSCKAKVVVHPKTDKPIGAKTQEGKERCREAAKRGMIEYWKRRKCLI